MVENGFYIIKDLFFTDFPDPYLKGNKKESRPHYYAIKDKNSDLYWMIPLSSKTEKYKRIIGQKEKQGKPCDILHILKLDGKHESVFLIQDIFPVSEKYILRPYTLKEKQLVLTREKQITEIQRKANKIINLKKRGIRLTPTQADVFKIYEKLRQENKK